MKIGFTYDLRDDYLAQGYNEEAAAEFDRPETITAIVHELENLGHQVVCIGNLQALLIRLLKFERWDIVFNIAEGVHGLGREAQIPAVLDAYKIPYTFSDPMVLCLTLHKGMTKSVVRDCGIATADFKVVENLSDLMNLNISYPLFAKPIAEGSSKGISGASVIRDKNSLETTCRRLFDKYKQPVLVESYLPGREFTVGILGSAEQAVVLGVMEVLLLAKAETGVYSLFNKENYENLVDYRLQNGALGEQIGELAIKAWRVLGCRDAGRIDIRLDAKGVPHFIEVNPLPGLNPVRSDLAIMSKLLDKKYQTLISTIFSSAMQRIEHSHSSELSAPIH